MKLNQILLESVTSDIKKLTQKYGNAIELAVRGTHDTGRSPENIIKQIYDTVGADNLELVVRWYADSTSDTYSRYWTGDLKYTKRLIDEHGYLYKKYPDRIVPIERFSTYNDFVDKMEEYRDTDLRTKEEKYKDIQKFKKIPMDKKSRYTRAEAMGFDTSTIWYRGTRRNVIGNNGRMAGNPDYAMFFTTNPNVANSFSGIEDGAIIYPVFINYGRLIEFPSKDGRWSPYNFDIKGTELYSDSSLIVRQIYDKGHYGPDDPEGNINYIGDQLALGPESSHRVRSIHAAFDPDKVNSTNMMEGVAPDNWKIV